MKSINKIIFGVLVFYFFSLAGCMLNKDEAPEPVALAYLSIYNGAPLSTGVDIFIDNVKANTQPFLYSKFSGYNSFYLGNRNLKFTPQNATNNLIDTTLTLLEDKVYSLFITNEASNYRPFVTEDIWSEPAWGKAMIRIINISPDAPDVDLFIGENEGSFFKDQKYRTVSAFKEIESGTKKLILKASDGGDIVASLSEVLIQEKRIYTLIVRGYVDTPEGNSNTIGIQLVTNHTLIN